MIMALVRLLINYLVENWFGGFLTFADRSFDIVREGSIDFDFCIGEF